VTTLDDRPTEKMNDYWTAALKFYATGRTAGALRALAADPVMTRGLALMCGITEVEELEQLLGIADAIDAYAAAGLTPEGAYSLAGLEEIFGCTFAEFDPDANRVSVPAQRASLSAA
jgi:hypothetical protein